MPNNVMTRSTNTINSGDDIQAFVPDPAKCLGSMAANSVFKIGAGGNVDITGWLAIALYPASTGQVTFNGNVNQVLPVYANQQNVIFIHPNVTQVVPSVVCTVCGM
jgi:hypothetical protein